MLSNILILALPFFAFLINALTQVIMCRFRFAGLLKSVFLGCSLGAIVLFSFPLFLNSKYTFLIENLFINILVYLNLSYCYFHFINLGETARRIRILSEIKESGGVGEKKLKEIYNSEVIIRARIDRLIKHKQIRVEEDRYKTKQCVLLIGAKVLSFLRKLFFRIDYEI